MTQPGWDDERLEAAFRARFDRPAPPMLESDVHVRIAGTSPRRFGSLRRSGPTWGLAAAAAVVVLAVTLTVGLGGFGWTGGSPAPSDPDSAPPPGASATPTAQAIPGEVLDLPVIDVPDAISIRDAGVDDREFAVLGWFTPAPPISCGGDAGKMFVSPVQLRCPDQLVWLTEDAESLFHRTGNRSDSETPRGPALNPDLDGLDTSWFPDLPAIGVEGGSTPVDVVFIGHFDDRRAALCPDAEQAACRDRFVVDSVAIVHGVPQPVSKVHDARGAVSSDEEIEAIVTNEAPDSPILSLTVVDGATGLAAIEPSLGTGQENLIDQPILWVVRVLESGRVVTYVVIDGSDAIYEMNPDGDAILVDGKPPAPEATASVGPWPPAGAPVVVLTSQVGAGEPPARVAVVDESGRLAGVAEKGAVDPSTITFDGRFGAYAEPGTPGRIHLTWVGGICDSQITVTVAADLRSIAFDMGPQPDCDSIGVGRQLVLDFSGTVDVPAIQVGEAGAEPTPEPSASPGFTVDCGPLGPDTCSARVRDIIYLNQGRRVASIEFTDDECGSYRVSFSDGPVTYTIIDCLTSPEPR